MRDMAMQRWTILVFVVFSCSCAFTPLQVDLPTGGPASSWHVAKHREVIVVTPFRDSRVTGSRCGMKKNGYNMDTADVSCNQQPQVWVSRLLSDGLRRAGFAVKEVSNFRNERNADGGLLLQGSLVKLFSEPVLGFWSSSIETDISVKLMAKTRSGLRAQRVFFSKGTAVASLSERDAYEASIRDATDDLIKNMVGSVIELENSNRYVTH